MIDEGINHSDGASAATRRDPAFADSVGRGAPDSEGPFSANDGEGVRLLCEALADALEYVRKATGRDLSEAEISDIRKTLVRRLTMDHDSGERDPDALKNAALREVFASRAAN